MPHVRGHTQGLKPPVLSLWERPKAEALGYPEANTASSDDPMHGGRTCMGERIRRRVDLDDETADDFFLQRVDCEKRSSAAEPLSRD